MTPLPIRAAAHALIDALADWLETRPALPAAVPVVAVRPEDDGAAPVVDDPSVAERIDILFKNGKLVNVKRLRACFRTKAEMEAWLSDLPEALRYRLGDLVLVHRLARLPAGATVATAVSNAKGRPGGLWPSADFNKFVYDILSGVSPRVAVTAARSPFGGRYAAKKFAREIQEDVAFARLALNSETTNETANTHVSTISQ
ncbi:MAG: hypothetical protein AB7F99_18745 [Vicinamibacterales bacterium]